MHRTAIICSVLVISAFTVSAQDYAVNITFHETENCKIDCFQIQLKFTRGENFTKNENVSLDKAISGNIHNFTEIVRALQLLVTHTDDATSQHAVRSTTKISSENINTQDKRTSDENNSSVPTKSVSSKLIEATTSTGKHAKKSTETTTTQSANHTTPHEALGKPLKRSHEAETGVLVTLTVVILIIAGAWVGRKYYRRGTSESYFLLR